MSLKLEVKVVTNGRAPADNQLVNYEENLKKDPGSATNGAGNPVPNLTATQTVGLFGPVLMQDVHLLDSLGHFARERIPERVVHAKGAGAFGVFEVTNDITNYCAAKIFSSVGKKTPMAIRFSQVAGNLGSADTVRDVRGFAMKFYTEDGIWDLTGNNTPIFFIRDPTLFPLFIHTQKRNPVTNLRDWDAYWDFMSLRPETTHQFLMLYADRGLPNGHRFQHGFGSHTYSMVNKNGHTIYCKFHLKSNQGIKNLTEKEAKQLRATDPDYALRDLYNAIANKDYPSWSMYIQVMTLEEAAKHTPNPFDLTKVWSQKTFPLNKVGIFTLNRNPSNYFAEVEQMAFSPANMVPGIGPSPDKILQSRLFSYRDTQFYRLGVNHLQLPVNCPFRVKNYQRDGLATLNSQGGAPNYFPNSYKGPKSDFAAETLTPSLYVAGDVKRYESGDQDNYTQARDFYLNTIGEDERKRMTVAIAEDLRNATDEIQDRVVKVFSNVDVNFGKNIARLLPRKPETDL